MLRPQYPSLYLTWSQSPVFSTSRQYYFQLSEISVHQGSFCITLPSILHGTIFLYFRRSMDFSKLGSESQVPPSILHPVICMLFRHIREFIFHTLSANACCSPPQSSPLLDSDDCEWCWLCTLLRQQCPMDCIPSAASEQHSSARRSDYRT